jgi:hypothetical protein
MNEETKGRLGFIKIVPDPRSHEKRKQEVTMLHAKAICDSKMTGGKLVL